MATGARPAAQNSVFETAYRKLKDSVSSVDANAFQATSFEEVWRAAEEIEEAHKARGNLRNMRRIEPFLKSLENYSKVVEILCNGTPYLPWIWAPIKLMLQLANQYTTIFDKLLEAYRQIAEVMPQFGRLQLVFQDDPNFQIVLGMVYSDILEFHRRAYKFFARKLADEQHDDELERLAEKRQEGTCEWVFRNALFQAWKGDAHGDPVLWVKGIPGAGKTILSTYIIRKLQEEGRFTTAYHICNSYTTGKHLLGEIMRSITVQFLRSNLDIASYIFENYANKGLTPSATRVKGLLEKLLQTIPSIRIIIDGLDEYPVSDQRTILNELLSLSKLASGQCRILFSNRESENINKRLNGRPTLSLRDQNADLTKDIELYVHAELDSFRHDFGDPLVDKIERQIVAKADGMFLWVRLIMQSLEQCHSQQELLDAVATLPEGLDKAYKRILDDLRDRSSDKSIRILQWIACSFRILKVHEIKDGIVFQTPGIALSEQTKLVDSFWEHCKPLIEKGPKNTLDFVHYSAKEYVLHETSGPFLDSSEAHYGLAISCMNYMNSSYCFIDPQNTSNALTIRVLRGYHGLHHYANKFWFQHLLQYAKSGDTVEDEELDEPLEEIREFWKQEPGSGAEKLKLDDTTSADKIRAQLKVLDSIPIAQGMGLDILTFQKFLSQENSSHQAPENLKSDELRHDPTHFSEISQRYQNIVRNLIHCSPDSLPEGVQHYELQSFKQTYLDSAFICRYRECPRYSDGFGSSEERHNHEKIHTKPLRCVDPKCDFFARGFTSKTGLLKHNRKYHPLPEETAPPAFEPRKLPEVVPVPSPVQIPQPAPPRVEVIPAPVVPEPHDREGPNKPATRRRVYNRAEGLRRHKLSHEDPKFFCPQEDCGRAFYRPDLLARHEFQHQREVTQA
ncbi:Vegetative incompatibility protein HET-E-1 [Lachnellula suecica]|uniref:Vegetative incompatibility protein HET-E-1 n=1 Tax=Lachnellula suecica TaxID=602035 RepID=A0A8T9CGW4_9HELO|nr:Vegetative incompatibility protein HET-E-1 [Lachnellula suecica]